MKYLSLCLFLACCLSVAKVANADSSAQEVFNSAMAFVEPYWDERVALIWTPNAAESGTGRVHRVRESAWFALGLLERDQPGDRARAARVFDAVLEQQIDDPGQPWDATFYRFPEEIHVPLFPEMWRDYDPNWRQFMGTTFALALIKFEDRLTPELRDRLAHSILRALDGERHQGRLQPTYTNIALMQSFLLGYAGSRLSRPDLVHEAEVMTEAVYAVFAEHGAFEEYNSPTYYGVDFFGLALWRAYGFSDRMRTLGAEMEAKLWRDTAAFYHAGLQNLCGPYDRAYGMDMTRYASLTGLWLRMQFDAKTAPFPPLQGPMGHAHDFVYAAPFFVLPTQIPDDARESFSHFTGERLVERKLPRGRIATAWLGADMMLGGEYTRKGHGAGGEHNQFHPATIHWRTPAGDIGWVLLTQSSRVDVVAKPRELAISAVGDSTFRISAANVVKDMLSREQWKLPGLKIAVDTDATAFDSVVGDGWVDVTYRDATHVNLRVE